MVKRNQGQDTNRDPDFEVWWETNKNRIESAIVDTNRQHCQSHDPDSEGWWWETNRIESAATLKEIFYSAWLAGRRAEIKEIRKQMQQKGFI